MGTGLGADVVSSDGLTYTVGQTVAVREASMRVAGGEVVAITGPSGSGKSTLLFLLAGVLRPDRGSVRLNGVDLGAVSDRARAGLRLRQCGFVMQFGDLIPELTLAENVELPLRLTGMSARKARATADGLLARLGLDGERNRTPSRVSGGQAQRAAIARALVHRPSVVFADEPTGALDSHSAAQSMSALLDLARAGGSALILVTHAGEVAATADRVLTMRDGVLQA
ncbi:ATP-binding cassette domain-containing protein [Micromonospora sp. CPCC 206060]|uniref:ABC transporter ATP-binding protein n=1 Tax=Micromonospora sp. CPCC 206060 TaxID=3122406 RepID=UPI002FF36743